jgi:hypothetical protein
MLLDLSKLDLTPKIEIIYLKRMILSKWEELNLKYKKFFPHKNLHLGRRKFKEENKE